MKSKKELIEELSQTVQRSGTLTVLHTNAVASEVGLSATEFEAMDIIRQYHPMSAGKLSLYCGLTTGAITGIVDRLERAGFARRRIDPADRRRVLLEPCDNPQSHQQVAALYGPVSQAFASLVTECTVEQLQFLVDIHSKMNEAMEKIITEMGEK
jgi:DNA-binding MarR family transcriptional regulator